MSEQIDRRHFLKEAGRTAISATVLGMAGPALIAADESTSSFSSAWLHEENRVWAGPEYWANPLQDWRIREGRLECFSPGGDRNVALLTRDVSNRKGDLHLSVRLGKIDNAPLETGFVGFRVGIKNV